jgi:hypothetical protein
MIINNSCMASPIHSLKHFEQLGNIRCANHARLEYEHRYEILNNSAILKNDVLYYLLAGHEYSEIILAGSVDLQQQKGSEMTSRISGVSASAKKYRTTCADK